MKKCDKCNSEKIKTQMLSFEDDLHNIIKVFNCLNCGYEKTELINIQEEHTDVTK